MKTPEKTPAQTKRINTAFERMSTAIENFIIICDDNDSPVKSISVKDGDSKPTVIYQKPLKAVKSCVQSD